jgi:hypothetical protein
MDHAVGREVVGERAAGVQVDSEMPVGGLRLDQVKRLKELEREDARLRKAVSDLTLEKVVLEEAAPGRW